MQFIYWAIIILTLFLFLNFYVIPKRRLSWQVQQFRNRGHKVLAMPYSLLYPPVLKIMKSSKEDALSFMKEEYPKYDVVIFNNNTSIVIDISSAELSKQFVQLQMKGNFKKSKGFASSIERVSGQGLILLHGDVWKQRRRILNQVFNFDFLRLITTRIAEIAEISLDQVQSEPKDKNGEQKLLDLLDFTTSFASNSLAEIFFGSSLRNEKIDNKRFSLYLTELIDETNSQTRSAFFVLFGVNFFKLGFREIDRVLSRKIHVFNEWGHKTLKDRIEKIQKQKNQTKSQYEKKDLVEALAQHLSYKQIFDEFRTFSLAGVQTTATFLQSAIFLVVTFPEVEKKVRQEISQYMEKDDYSYENLKKFKYLEKVFKEIIRMYGPVPGLMSRKADNDILLKDVPILKDARVRYSFVGFHMNENYYKNPLQFRPERWEKTDENIPALADNGFHSGPRTCIGKHFSILESKIGFIKFFKRYKKIVLQTENPCWDFGLTYRLKKCIVKVYSE